MKLKNKWLIVFVCLDIAVIIFTIFHAFRAYSVPASAYADNVYNWYYKPRTDGKQPDEPTEFAFIKSYDGYWISDSDEKIIYLTFDAGYENGYTAQILDTLKKHNAPAAFFLVGHYIASNPDLVSRMFEEGHLVCNHSSHHKNMTKIADYEAFKAEITEVEDLCSQITGKQMSKYFRPPEGSFSERSLDYTKQLGYKSIFWSFAYADWNVDAQPSESKAFDTIISRTHPGMVVLLHSTSATNAKVLDSVLTEWESMGYRLESLDNFPFEN